MRRTGIIAAFAAAVLLVVAAPAHAGTYLDEAASALQHSQIYVSPAAGASPNAQSELSAQLRHGDNLYIALLPAAASAETNGDVQAFADQLSQHLGGNAIVAVGIGRDIRAVAAKALPSGVAADLAQRASGVSTSALEALGTFIVNVHNYQDQHPEAVVTGGSGSGGGGTWIIFLVVALVLLGAAGGFWFYRTRIYSPDAEPKIKLSAPNQMHDELRDILALREHIADRSLRDLITQMVKDTQEVFTRLGVNSPSEVSTATVTFETHLQNVRDVLKQYIDVQNNPRYYESPSRALADGREAIEGFAEYVLASARRAGRSQLTMFNVNTKILSAQRYS
ncbi:MAG TPA: hypothetical protein VLF67_00755 [Candidatus Saccharimonas sp.]|nr:hypothetical protein [Candidatus Saccharimonas sp.]